MLINTLGRLSTFLILSSLNRSSNKIVVVGLGRGVDSDGKLSPYGEMRVEDTLGVALLLQSLRFDVVIIWCGGRSRTQLDTPPKRSEGEAMYAYSMTLYDSKGIPQFVETQSTSTVGNFTGAAQYIDEDDLIVVVTDELHYRFGRIRFLTWLIFPRNEAIMYSLHNSKDTNWKSVGNQISTIILTAAFMTGVKRGNLIAIQKRQDNLQRFHDWCVRIVQKLMNVLFNKN